MNTTRQRRAHHSSRARARRRKNGEPTVQWVGQPRDSSDLETETGMSRGVRVLLAWCRAHDVTPYQFALRSGIDPSTMRRLCVGKRESMSVDIGLKIQTGTGGEVPLEIWGK